MKKRIPMILYREDLEVMYDSLNLISFYSDLGEIEFNKSKVSKDHILELLAYLKLLIDTWDTYE